MRTCNPELGAFTTSQSPAPEHPVSLQSPTGSDLQGRRHVEAPSVCYKAGALLYPGALKSSPVPSPWPLPGAPSHLRWLHLRTSGWSFLSRPIQVWRPLGRPRQGTKVESCKEPGCLFALLSSQPVVPLVHAPGGGALAVSGHSRTPRLRASPCPPAAPTPGVPRGRCPAAVFM